MFDNGGTLLRVKVSMQAAIPSYIVAHKRLHLSLSAHAACNSFQGCQVRLVSLRLLNCVSPGGLASTFSSFFFLWPGQKLDFLL